MPSLLRQKVQEIVSIDYEDSSLIGKAIQVWEGSSPCPYCEHTELLPAGEEILHLAPHVRNRMWAHHVSTAFYLL